MKLKLFLSLFLCVATLRAQETNLAGSSSSGSAQPSSSFTPFLPTPSGAPDGWGSIVILNGQELHWNDDSAWYDTSWNSSGSGAAFVQPAYGGPTWLAEFNDNSNGSGALIQQYFTPGANGIPLWTSPVISFYPWGADAGVPSGGMTLNGVSGLSFGYHLGKKLPSDIPFAADGSLVSFVGGFTGVAQTPTANVVIASNPSFSNRINANGGITVSGAATTVSATPAQITADKDDFNLADGSYYQRWSTNAAHNVTGLTWEDGGQGDGLTFVITNVGSFNIILVNESASSTDSYRFHNSTGADITIAPDHEVNCWYDATLGRWRVTKRGF